MQLVKIVLRQSPQSRPPPLDNPLSSRLHDIIGTKYFQNFIMSAISLNVVFMAITWFGEPEMWIIAREWINYVFTIIFLFEVRPSYSTAIEHHSSKRLRLMLPLFPA